MRLLSCSVRLGSTTVLGISRRPCIPSCCKQFDRFWGISGEDEEEMADEEVAAEAKGEDEDAGEVEAPGVKLYHVIPPLPFTQLVLLDLVLLESSGVA